MCTGTDAQMQRHIAYRCARDTHTYANIHMPPEMQQHLKLHLSGSTGSSEEGDAELNQLIPTQTVWVRRL